MLRAVLGFVVLLTLIPAGVARAEVETATYVVQAGDSLGAIALSTGVDLATLIALNGIEDADFVMAGAELKLPGETSTHTATASGGVPATYVVQAGDTLGAIADQFGADVDQFVGMNRLASADLILEGQELAVPPIRAGATVTSVPTPTPSASPTPSPSPTPTPAGAAAPSAPPTATPWPTSPPRPTPVLGPTSVAPVSAAGAPASVQMALRYLGAPYVYGGVSPEGFDCSGFLYFVQDAIGRPIPRDILEQYEAGAHPSELQPGDLVFFQDTDVPGLSHNGMYLGNGQFIHAVDERRGVVISNLTDAYWMEHWYGATRLG